MINIRRSEEGFQEGDNLFLEMKLVKLEVSDEQLGQIKIVVYKGLQKLDQTQVFNLQPNSEFVIDQSILNFHIRNYEEKKNITFKIALETNTQPPNQIGSFDIQANNIIMPFIKDGVNTFARMDPLTEKVKLEYMLFVEKTKAEVEKSVRSYQESKKSAKIIELANQWTITSPAHSEKQSTLNPKVEHSQQAGNNHHITPHSKKFKKPTPFQIGSQKQNLEKASNRQVSNQSNKIWFEMEDGEEIVNNLAPKKRASAVNISSSGQTGTGVKIVGGLAVLGILMYLIILLDDMNYGMDLVRGIIQTEIRQSYL